MRRLALLSCGLVFALGFAQEPVRSPVVLTLDDVIKLVKNGVSEEVIVARIKRNNRPFDLNPDEILELTKSGVSNTVIRYLMDPARPYTTPEPPPAPPPPAPPEVKIVPKPPKDPLVLKLPPEPGLYWMSNDTPGDESFVPVEMKALVPLNRKGVGSLLTGGLKKAHKVGSLGGAKAPVRASKAANVFYLRLPPKVPIEDLLLLRMETGGGRRILDFGPKPEKPAFPEDAILQFESKEAAEGVYRLAVAPHDRGEFVFLILGTGDEKKGVLGKGYDWGIDRGRE